MGLVVGLRAASLRPLWWTIPDKDKLPICAFAEPSDQLRDKVLSATLRSLYHISLYRCLILAAKQHGAKVVVVGRKLHTLIHNIRSGINLFKFIYGHFNIWKLAYRYVHAPTDACPLCPEYPLNTCTHIAGECSHILAHKSAASTQHVY